MRIIDVCGMSCPEPVIRTNKELETMKKGEKLKVVVDNETARENITRLVDSKGCKKITVNKEGDCCILEIEV
ncbi:MAG: sulfurtransferase TusA family protein [Bacillota bacterium]|jgi:tRNA 2-thiouridine synthesizing protein A